MKDIMVYKDFKQPNIIDIDDNIRLRAYDGNYKQAVSWYQDPVVYYNSEGITDISKIPDEKYVQGMYEYLCSNGEVYFIEVLENGEFVPVGDVTLKEENLPIAIGVAKYRGKGIGKKVMRAIIKRAKEVGITKLYSSTIYDYNIASQKMHESLGFKCVEVEGNELRYELRL
jgi:RimJ/RimL family protein N-acetyltransferase